jgi:hypothetical protein
MTSRQLILVLVVLIGLGILFTAGKLLIAKPAESVSPTPSVSIEPEASSTVSPTPSGSLKTTIGSKVSANGVTVTPLAVVEDSRCPVDVQCIQAGTVRITAEVSVAMGSTTRETLTLAKPLQTGTHTVTLIQVTPVKYSGVTIPAANYMFMFEVK